MTRKEKTPIVTLLCSARVLQHFHVISCNFAMIILRKAKELDLLLYYYKFVEFTITGEQITAVTFTAFITKNLNVRTKSLSYYGSCRFHSSIAVVSGDVRTVTIFVTSLGSPLQIYRRPRPSSILSSSVPVHFFTENMNWGCCKQLYLYIALLSSTRIGFPRVPRLYSIWQTLSPCLRDKYSNGYDFDYFHSGKLLIFLMN